MRRERILGIPFDNVGVEEALRITEDLVRKKKGRTIVHLSLPTLMMARRSTFLRIFLEEADIIIPTGKLIHWGARVLKRPVLERIDPSSFIKMLFAQSVELNKSVYLLGGREGVIEKVHVNLKREIPRIFVIGKCRGNYPKHLHDNVVKAIGKASPDYLFIGLGSPLEEQYVERNREKLNAGITVLIGGLFDIFAGSGKRSISPSKFHGGEGYGREIQHRGGFKKIWRVPVFIILVFFERIFWRR